MQLSRQVSRSIGSTSTWGAEQWLCVALLVSVLCGCEPTLKLSAEALRNPRDVALSCVKDGTILPLSQCNSALGDEQLRTFVSAGSQGTIAVGRPHAQDWLDNDKSIPGYTPWLVDGLPQQVTVTAADPTHLYTTLPVLQQVARIDILTGKTVAAVTFPKTTGPTGLPATPTLTRSDQTRPRTWRQKRKSETALQWSPGHWH